MCLWISYIENFYFLYNKILLYIFNFTWENIILYNLMFSLRESINLAISYFVFFAQTLISSEYELKIPIEFSYSSQMVFDLEEYFFERLADIRFLPFYHFLKLHIIHFFPLRKNIRLKFYTRCFIINFILFRQLCRKDREGCNEKGWSLKRLSLLGVLLDWWTFGWWYV